jgi:glycosyltransferase involved in cell wall biosynthesis
MRILMLTSEFSPAAGGIATYARELAAAVAQLGAEVTVVAPDYSCVNVLIDDLSLPFAVRRFPGGLHSARETPRKIRLVRDVIAAEHYDIVHAADWPFFIPAALSRSHTRARLLMTVHGTEINEMQTVAKRLAVRATGVFGARTEVVANSGFTRSLLLEHFTVPDERVRAIPLGVSQFWFGNSTHRQVVRRRLGIADDAIVMVTVARLTRRKGHLVTLAALIRLPANLRQQLVWLVVGPDGESEYVNEFHNAARNSDCDVRFLGLLPDEAIRDIHAAADFFCLTGLTSAAGRVEGFGLVYLEAGACGLPSVATAVGGVPEAVIARKTGLLVDPTTEDIEAAIAYLIENPADRATLGAAAREHARYLSWRRCAGRTYGLEERVRNPVSLVTPTLVPNSAS